MWCSRCVLHPNCQDCWRNPPPYLPRRQEAPTATPLMSEYCCSQHLIESGVGVGKLLLMGCNVLFVVVLAGLFLEEKGLTLAKLLLMGLGKGGTLARTRI